MDKNAPQKWVPCKGESPAWITNEMYSFIDEREYCTRKFNKKPTPTNKLRRDDARRLAQRCKTYSQRHYIETVLNDSKRDSSKMWKCRTFSIQDQGGGTHWMGR